MNKKLESKKMTPAEWEIITHSQIIDPDGWRFEFAVNDDRLGLKIFHSRSISDEITKEEFIYRMSESTIKVYKESLGSRNDK